MVVDGHILSPETQVVLLLCGSFGLKGEDGMKPLTPSQYNRLESWLLAEELGLGDLLTPPGMARLQQAGESLLEVEAAARLLERGGGLALAVEKWANQGIWVLSRNEPDYPECWRERLRHLAPPLVFGVGPKHLLSRGGLAVLGSRKADTQSLEFSRNVGQRGAREGMQIISGGAKGVDQEAMLGALSQGGTVVGILADSLGKASVAGKYRQAIREGRLALVSACAPEASFHIGNAMARNKLLYALADWSLVVCAETDKGGTWSGAQENLQKGWTPLLVRTGVEVPEGNTRLLEEGGLSLDEAEVRQDTGGLRELLEQAVRRRERLAATAKEVAEAAATADPAGAFWEHQVWPTIAGICRAWGSLNEQDLVGALGIEKAQGKAWLKRAVEERKLRKLGRPVRYRLAERSLFEEG